MRCAPGTTAGHKAAHTADRVTHWQNDGKIIRAPPEVQPSPRGKHSPDCNCTQESAKKDKTRSEVRPKVELARGIMLPTKKHKKRLGPEDASSQHQPHRSPEFVFAHAELAMPVSEPANRCQSADHGEESKQRHTAIREGSGVRSSRFSSRDGKEDERRGSSGCR